MWTVELLQDFKTLGGFPLYCALILASFILGEFGLSSQLFIGLILAFSLTALIRIFYFKQRPVRQSFKTWQQKIDASSFPSLHSMRAAVLATVLAAFFDNRILAVLFFALAVAVASARVLQKRHHMSDVVAGLILGILVGFASIWLARFIS